MKKKIFIRGNFEHYSKIIKALESRGGKITSDILSYYDSDPKNLYYIEKSGQIHFTPANSVLGEMLIEYGEELFPEPDYKFKSGDKVRFRNQIMTITKCYNEKGNPCYFTKENDHRLYKEDELYFYDPQILTWEDMITAKTPVDGFFLSNGKIQKPLVNYTANETLLFHTEMQAKSVLAMAKISQLIEQTVYGGAITNDEWENNDLEKHCIWREGNSIHIGYTYRDYRFLAFHTHDQAKLFLKHNKQMVKDYLMIE